MIKQAVNPYLPANEYIPDGEPRVFGDRVYVYGSHDRFNAPIFCMNDYICYSASIHDLSDWKYEGVIFRKKQDPKNPFGVRLLFAPDVVQGPDGRYYMYYSLDFSGIMGVAVCDTPAGKYKYLGDVVYTDGVKWGRRKGDAFAFDPGVLVDDDGRVYLYSGFYKRTPSLLTGMKHLSYDGGYAVELAADMRTIKGEQRLVFPKSGKGAFEGHEFFEASSIRKIDGRYYFVYSSRWNHELCYAVSEQPMEGFTYGGTLVSNGDIGIHNYKDERHAANYTGNNHGGMLILGKEHYIFYHRQTNRHSYSRQTCAEKLKMREDGGFDQAEMTSCGLNPGPLPAKGSYEARIACNLWSKEGTGRYDLGFGWLRYQKHPYMTQDYKDGDRNARQYIANMRDGATAGFKYFEHIGGSRISVTIRGNATGCIKVARKENISEIVATIPIESKGRKWSSFQSDMKKMNGVSPLYFQFEGRGKLDFLAFEFENW